jgi:hypothetical protein
MSVEVTSAVWKTSKANGTALLVLLAIADYADRDGRAYPSITSIAEKVRTSERNVQKLLRRLEAMGEITVQIKGGRHGCNVYFVRQNGEHAFTPSETDSIETVNARTPQKGEQMGKKGERTDTGVVNARTPDPSIDPSIDPSEGESAREATPTPTPPGVLVLKASTWMPKGMRLPGGFLPAGTGQNPVQVYYERFPIQDRAARLTPMQEADLVEHCPDLQRLREVITAYSRTTYKPGNIGLILDWYAEGVPNRHETRGPNGSNSRGTGPNAARPSFPTYVREAYDADLDADLNGGRRAL